MGKHGKTHELSMAMFDSYVKLPEGSRGYVLCTQTICRVWFIKASPHNLARWNVTGRQRQGSQCEHPCRSRTSSDVPGSRWTKHPASCWLSQLGSSQIAPASKYTKRLSENQNQAESTRIKQNQLDKCRVFLPNAGFSCLCCASKGIGNHMPWLFHYFSSEPTTTAIKARMFENG